MSCGVGHRHGSDPVLLWLWHRLAAVAPIKPPYAMGAALKSQKKKVKLKIKKKKRKRNATVVTAEEKNLPFFFPELHLQKNNSEKHEQISQIHTNFKIYYKVIYTLIKFIIINSVSFTKG